MSKVTTRKSQKALENETFIDALRIYLGVGPLYNLKGEKDPPTLLSNGIFVADPRQAAFANGCGWNRPFA